MVGLNRSFFLYSPFKEEKVGLLLLILTIKHLKSTDDNSTCLYINRWLLKIVYSVTLI